MSEKTCPGPGQQDEEEPCGRPIHGKGLCSQHLKQQRRGEELRPVMTISGPVCSYVAPDGTACGRKFVIKGLCRGHDRQRREGLELTPLMGRGGGRTCSIPFDDGTVCDKPLHSLGMCTMHRRRHTKGQPMGQKPRKAVRPEPRYAPEPEPTYWDPAKLTHAKGKPKAYRKPTHTFGGPTRLVRIDPGTQWDAWRTLCLHVTDPAELAELAEVLGIAPETRAAA